MIQLPLQTTAGTNLVLLALVGSLAISIVLSFVVGRNGLRGYRRSNDRRLLLLALGIVLLSGGAILFNIALSTLTRTPEWLVATAVDTVRLCGLLIIVIAIYDTR